MQTFAKREDRAQKLQFAMHNEKLLMRESSGVHYASGFRRGETRRFFFNCIIDPIPKDRFVRDEGWNLVENFLRGVSGQEIAW